MMTIWPTQILFWFDLERIIIEKKEINIFGIIPLTAVQPDPSTMRIQSVGHVTGERLRSESGRTHLMTSILIVEAKIQETNSQWRCSCCCCSTEHQTNKWWANSHFVEQKQFFKFCFEFRFNCNLRDREGLLLLIYWQIELLQHLSFVYHFKVIKLYDRLSSSEAIILSVN